MGKNVVINHFDFKQRWEISYCDRMEINKMKDSWIKCSLFNKIIFILYLNFISFFPYAVLV